MTCPFAGRAPVILHSLAIISPLLKRRENVRLWRARQGKTANQGTSSNAAATDPRATADLCYGSVYMKRKVLYSFLSICVFLNLWIGFRVLSSGAETDDHAIDYAAIAGFTRAVQLIRQDYVDGDAVSYKKLMYSALHAMLPHLDPHSQFLEPNDLKDRENETRGEFGGFGFTISRREQGITILS